MNKNIKNELIDKIKSAIEEKAMKYGFMGDEMVSTTLILTDEELEVFQEIDLDEDHYWFEIENNEVTISHTENIIGGNEK